MTFHPSLRGLSAVTAIVASLAIAQPASAQESRIITSGGSGGVVSFHNSTPAISDEAIQRLIADHLASQMSDSADSYHVLLVVDANDRYVNGKATKAMVITYDGSNGQTNFVVGDTTGASGGGAVVTFQRNGNGTVSSGSGAVTISRTESGSHNGVVGSGYAMDQIASLGMKRFAAGTLATSAVTVTVVKLK